MTISNNVHADQQAAQDPRDGPLKELASARFIPLSDRYFEHVGAPLPSHVDWQRMVKVDEYRPDGGKALAQLASTVLVMTLCWTLLTMLPWYLLPLAWVFAGVAATGLFVIGRDCALSAWSPNRLVNDIIGTISFAPLMTYIQTSYVSAFFAPSTSDKSKERVSTTTVWTVIASIVFLIAMVYFTGVNGLIKYWLLPFVAFHLWLRFYAKLNMVVPESSTVNGNLSSMFAYFKLPSWLDFMSNGLNMCVNNGVALARIPSYHMQSVRRAMEDRLAPYTNVCVVNWRVLLKLMGRSKTAIVHATQRAHAFVSTSEDAAPDATPKPSEPQYSLFTLRGLSQFAKRVHWIHVTLLFGTPAIALYGAFVDQQWHFRWPTFWWAVVYYFFTGLGITAGYHRLWAHRAYDASPLVQWVLSFAASGAVEGSAIWWCRGHRAHHRYTDTPKDPYSASRGFWYAHIGWMLMHPDGENYGKANVSDLKRVPALVFQHKTYPLQVLVWGFIVPTVVAGFGWNDWRGGYYMAAVMRLIFVHHSTFCVNSVAHFFGSHTFDDARTPRDHLITAFLTLGEGYHNFHHEFPNDYRNGIRAYDYDPTKWLIRSLSLLGLAHRLKVFPHNEVQKGKLNMKQKNLDALKAKLQWPAPLTTLPVWTMEEVKRRADQGQAVTVIDGVVHDVGHFIADHPGGESLIRSGLGKDASADFNGDVYKHSNAARNLMSNFRVATVGPHSAPGRDSKKEA